LQSFKGDAKLLAGGTDILVKMKARALMPKCLINLKRLRSPDLSFINRNAKGEISIGCLTTLSSIEESALIKEHARFLSDTAEKMASHQVRNIGTLGGNLCNAAPSADTAPPLIAAGAKVRLIGPEGERSVRLEDFFLNPGQTVLREDEILGEVVIPPIPSGFRIMYLKFGPREAMEIATVGTAVGLGMKNGCCESIRIILGAVAPRPLRATKAEGVLLGKEASEGLINEAARMAAGEATPISDVRGSADYRRAVVEALVRRAIRSAAQTCREEN
jgi:carbon-monoxide dehydrogenase medium subunit